MWSFPECAPEICLMSAPGDMRRSGDQKHKPHVDISPVLLQTLYILKRRPNSLHTALMAALMSLSAQKFSPIRLFARACEHLLPFMGTDRSQPYLRARTTQIPDQWKRRSGFQRRHFYFIFFTTFENLGRGTKHYP